MNATMYELELTLNGKKVKDMIPSDMLLIDYLRNVRLLTGSKKACGAGECGACTVLMNGRPIYSCITLALQAQGKEIETIENLSDGDTLHPIQEAYLDAGAVQCGYCTPGMIMSTKALLQKEPQPGTQCIKEAMAGNLCRCTGYQQIIEAVQLASERMEQRRRDS